MFWLATKRAIGDLRDLTFDNSMVMADPPDLPLSPMSRGTPMEEAQGLDQVLKSGLKITETKEKDTKDDDRVRIFPIRSQGSWVGAVQGQKVLKKYEVEIEMKNGVGSIVVPEEITKDVAPLWDDFLIGKFLDEAPHIAKIHAIVNKIWNLNDKAQKVEVFEVNSMMMKFRILNQADKNRILRRGMWNLAGVPVVVTKWSHVVEKEKPPTQSIPMWVHVKRVPLTMFSWQGLSYLTSPLGFPGRLHPETAQCLNVEEAKIFVNVDLTKDLPKQLNFNIKGEDVLVEYSYPRLPKKCVKCEKWGHNGKICPMGQEEMLEKQKEVEDGEIREDDGETTRVVTTGEKVQEGNLNEEENLDITDEVEEVIEQGKEIRDDENKMSGDGKTPETKKADHNEEWADVSPGKASRSHKELKFGQVSILTKSRFSVLASDDEEELMEKEVNDEEQKDGVNDEEQKDEDVEDSSEEKEEELVVPRQCLPRDSKFNHRYLKGGQTVQDAGPSYLNRKKPRRN